MGGGKTCFTRGLVSALAPASLHLVASPTFAIMNEYPGPVPVYHFDFYRLSSGHEIGELGFDDFFQGQGICIAEWSERLGDLLPKDHIRIRFEYIDEECRKISIAAGNSDLPALVEEVPTPAHIIPIPDQG
jgi:tRNA threonylcarbamoyladenosine biosynthesis protein TsaE